jgi:threonine dehydrogenase-like Zn-dependent dehydrogenase
MKAISVFPGKPNSVHLADLNRPSIEDVPNGRGVLVKVLRVGVDGTDKEINAAEYGAAPSGFDFLVIGHEGFGRVEAVGPNVTELKPGDYVVATVRRPGVEKGIHQAYEIQRRLKVWRPRRAAVMGAGTIGLLATLALRLRGIEVTTFARNAKPNLNAELIEAIGARYLITQELPIVDGAKQFGPFDMIFEATGNSGVVFDSMQALGKNGVLVLSSVTGGDRMIQVPADRINLEFVLGNKVMVGTVNANREYFEMGVRDMSQAEAEYPGWLSRLLTDPVRGLENYSELFKKLLNPNGSIKVFCEVAEL